MNVDTTSSRLAWRPRGMDARLAVAIVVTFGALFLLVSFTWISTTKLIREARWVDHTKDVIARLEAVQSAITDGETGQRGYLLTGDERYLEPYARASADARSAMEQVAAMTGDSDLQRLRADRLRQLVEERLGQLDLGVRLTRAGRVEDARKFIASGSGLETMDALRKVVAAMRTQERELLAIRNERSGATARMLLTTLGIGCTLLFGFLVLIWWLIRADLARRNRAEAAIRDREARIRRLIDANLIGVLFSDGNGVTDANEAFLSMVGIPRASFVSGKHRLFEFTAPEFSALDENCEKELRETGTCRPYQKELVRADGTRLPVLFGATSVDVVGGASFRASFVVDLSELRRIEAERNRLYEEARDAVKARDAFLSVAGHEIRTPLSALSLTAYQLARQVRALGNEKTVDLAGRLEKQVARLIRLSDELLDVSRLTSGTLHLDPEEMDLTAMARDVVDRLEESARRAGSPLCLKASGEVVGFWDRLRLDQVLSNLVSNALKFGAGEPVDVEVESNGESALLVVRDRGIGIDDADQRRIFERFQRAETRNRYPGMGLGLWICREIVEAHGGRIGVESRPGAGSRFFVSLPKATGGDGDRPSA
jgi:PAS domain S-box-containing protein